MSRIKRSYLSFDKKNKNRNNENVLLTNEASFYLCFSSKHRLAPSNDTYERTKTKFSYKVHVWGELSSKELLNLNFYRKHEYS